MTVAAAAALLVPAGAIPAAAGHHRHYQEQPGITTSYVTNALSAVGRQTEVTVSSTGTRPLVVALALAYAGGALRTLTTDTCAGRWLQPGESCTFVFGWDGGPGGGPPGPWVTILSNAPGFFTLIPIPYT